MNTNQRLSISCSISRLSLKQKSWTTSRNTSILFASLDTYENKAKLLRMLELKNSSLPEENVNTKSVHDMALYLIIFRKEYFY